MQISKINSINNNQPQFKGAAEQKYFMQTLKVQELKNIMQVSCSQCEAMPMAEYFASAFEKLKNHFSNLHDIVVQNNNHFYFESNGERIHISKSLSNPANSQLDYLEVRPFTAGVKKGERITYFYDVKDKGPERINRQKSLIASVRLSKNQPLSRLDQVGQEEFLTLKDSKFKPGIIIQSSVITDKKI